MDDIIIRLPCGFTTQYTRLNTDEIEINCIECDSHTLIIKECLNMPFNRFNLKAKELQIETKRLEDWKENFDRYKKDLQLYIHESLEKIKNKLNLRREEVKLDFCNKIDKHYDELWQRVEEEYTTKKDEFNNDVNSIEKNEIKLEQISDQMKFKDKIGTIETNLEKIKEKIQLIEKSISKLEAENVELIPNSNEFDIEELFGDLRIKQEIDVSQYKLSDEFKTLQTHLSDLKLISNDKVLTSSLGNTIKLWDLKTKNCLNQFDGHTSLVYSICVLDDDRFATCSLDQSIKIWSIKTGKFIKSWVCKAFILKLAKNGFLYSGEYDPPYLIHKWNYNTGMLVQSFKGHTDCVNCLEETLDGTLISGSDDKTIKFWHENGTCLKTFVGHTCCVNTLKILNKELLASGSNDKTIKIWNIKTGEIIKTLIDNSSAIFNINQLNGDLLLSTSQYDTIKVWDLNSSECVKIIENKENNILKSYKYFGIKLIVNESKDIIAAFDDGTIKIWKI